MGDLPKSVLIPFDIFEMLCHIHIFKDAKPSEVLEVQYFLTEKLKKTIDHANFEPHKRADKDQ